MATLVDLAQWLDSVPGKLDVRQEDLQAACDAQVKRIKTRTEQGVGFDGQVFAPYSEHTKLRYVDEVTLRKSGAMLAAITVTATDNSARIYFNDAVQEAKALAHNNGTKYLPARPFFGVGVQDRADILADIRASVFRRVNQ